VICLLERVEAPAFQPIPSGENRKAGVGSVTRQPTHVWEVWTHRSALAVVEDYLLPGLSVFFGAGVFTLPINKVANQQDSEEFAVLHPDKLSRSQRKWQVSPLRKGSRLL
jgi:hypothetical protein